MRPNFFADQHAFRAWLQANHDTETELLVGYYKKATGKPSMTWPESVDQALCFGWIDGVRRSIDAERYCIRFTPRRHKSNWSAVNLAKVDALLERGLMRPAGIAAYERRLETKSEVYSYEQQDPQLDPGYERRLRASKKAWTYFQKMPPSYRRQTTRWVMSAKREATRERRLGTLIECSAAGKKVPPLRTAKDE